MIKKENLIPLTTFFLNKSPVDTVSYIISSFIYILESFEILINNLDEEILKKGILRHPLAGRIDMNMTLTFLLSHFIHHKKIIHKLEKKINL